MFHKQKIKVYFTSGHTLTVRTTGFEFTWQCDNQIWRMIRDQHPMTHFNTYGGMTWAQHVLMFRLRPTLWGRICKLFGK